MIDIKNPCSYIFKRTVDLPNFKAIEGNCECGCKTSLSGVFMLVLQCFIFLLERVYGCKIACVLTGGARCKKHNEFLKTQKATCDASTTTRHIEPWLDAGDCKFFKVVGDTRTFIDPAEIATHAIRSGLFGGIGYKKYKADGRMHIHLDLRPGKKPVIW